jgi:membrane associated rhomboid family serine protease|tara:strand:- start:9872 stop:11104 length:1233 start_codon:yes stop_codon:yes gene_type:complete
VAGKSNADDEVPVWARSDAFPPKPSSQEDFGYIDLKGKVHSAKDADELAKKVSVSREGIDFVWTPASDQLVVPEEVSALHKSMRARQTRYADQDLSDGKRMGLVFGAIMIWTIYGAWKNGGGKIEALYSHQLTGLAAMLLFLFGLLPLYEGWKKKRHLAQTKPSDLAKEIPDAQFDTWLQRQKIPVTYFLLGCLLICGLAQVYLDWGKTQFDSSVMQAGLLKHVALQHPEQLDGGAWWRMLTAPMLHGNAIHFLMNAGGILYLGRRTETLARWPHLLIVFVAAAWVGGLATFYWFPNKIAVGASGGLMGLLGFMLVFETLHSRLVPKPARRRLLAGVLMMMVIGVIGMSFIDNAAHAGGLLAGMAYAAIVFPSTVSTHRPETMRRDIVIGSLAAIAIIFAGFMTFIKVLT